MDKINSGERVFEYQMSKIRENITGEDTVCLLLQIGKSPVW